MVEQVDILVHTVVLVVEAIPQVVTHQEILVVEEQETLVDVVVEDQVDLDML